MTDPRMLRLLALTNELHAIVAELGASISLTGSKYDGGSDGSIRWIPGFESNVSNTDTLARTFALGKKSSPDATSTRFTSLDRAE